MSPTLGLISVRGFDKNCLDPWIKLILPFGLFFLFIFVVPKLSGSLSHPAPEIWPVCQ